MSSANTRSVCRRGGAAIRCNYGQPSPAARTQKAEVPANQTATAAAWQTWLGKQHTTGKGAIADYANPEQMNRYTWYQAHGWKVPYPGDPVIYTPARVPGAYIPSADNG